MISEYVKNSIMLDKLSDTPHGTTDADVYFTCTSYIKQNLKRIKFLKQQIKRWSN
jgi:hypothetical protein